MLVHNIKEKCKERGISIPALERETGIGAGNIYRWDDNKPSVEKVATVAKALNTTVDELLKD